MNKDHQHNDQFLKDLTQEKNPFKTPENYFDNLSEKLSVDIFEQSLPKKTGFKTPDNYFENFKVNKPKSKIITLLPFISVAAVLAFGLFIFSNYNTPNIDALSNEEIINYLSSDDGLETNDILENTIINTDNIMFASLDNIEIDIDQLDMELNEYDIIEY
ncbi:hypothetical protein AXE80_03925 [Wenyingzhuangia fucanilytica]|uniref:Uncharacterized protein n=1 Tax=Wenyingzhuangia fucanilytica TaxID=1790137 RepID=A0A1B1Y403_9FLAO|nr:hypothetical protein [Wenyingzhuangia fucanilytica]ANW95477.1 hypothetical protein AXE80_03925 [Wenyingzhuangia fucanilytica]